MYKVARERANRRYKTRKAIDRLIASGYVNRHGEKIGITAEGNRALERLVKITNTKLRSHSWDRKWRMVAFDIPERHKGLRDQVRLILKRAGFRKLQHSVWIFPHACEELAALIKEDPRVASHLLYGVLETIENDAYLRKLFSLPTDRR